jgi:hypothetical protein
MFQGIDEVQRQDTERLDTMPDTDHEPRLLLHLPKKGSVDGIYEKDGAQEWAQAVNTQLSRFKSSKKLTQYPQVSQMESTIELDRTLAKS